MMVYKYIESILSNLFPLKYKSIFSFLNKTFNLSLKFYFVLIIYSYPFG